MTSPLRRPLLAGNWKMNLTLAQSVDLARAVKEGAAAASGEVAVFVPYTAITVVAEVLRGSPVRLGAQDVSAEAAGAFTGEISTGMLTDAGCQMTLIGHSERRKLYGETDEIVNKKLGAALKAGLTPVVCIGETLDERESQKTWRVLETQIAAGLKGFAPADLSKVVIAYEPVWAIGTGKTASPAQAQEAHQFVRAQLEKLHGKNFASGVRVLYGGSVTAENVDSLMAQPDVDGALVGGASLKKDAFLRIMGFKAAITPTQIAGLASEIEKRLQRSKLAIPVGVSNKHCHLTEAHFKILFGAAASPKKVKDIKQPGFYAAEELIDVQGPKGVVKKVRLVAPYRANTQIELAVTDAIAIGLKPPVRESGDVKGSAGAVLIGPAGKVEIKEGVIIAQRHVHFSPAEGKSAGMTNGEIVRVRCGTGAGRSTVFEDVVVRISDKYSLEFHVDTDEANAAGIKTGDFVHIA